MLCLIMQRLQRMQRSVFRNVSLSLLLLLLLKVHSSPWLVEVEVDCSLGEMSSREEEDCEWGGYFVCYDFSWFRELCRGAQDLSCQVSSGMFNRDGADDRVI